MADIHVCDLTNINIIVIIAGRCNNNSKNSSKRKSNSNERRSSSQSSICPARCRAWYGKNPRHIKRGTPRNFAYVGSKINQNQPRLLAVIMGSVIRRQFKSILKPLHKYSYGLDQMDTSFVHSGADVDMISVERVDSAVP